MTYLLIMNNMLGHMWGSIGVPGRPARTYIQQLCEDTGCNPEDLPEAMNNREEVAREGQGYPCWRHDMMMMNNN